MLQFTIAPDRRIERDEETHLQTLLEEGKSRVALLLGAPGSGKTCLLAKFAKGVTDQGVITLAIKADEFPHDETLDAWGKSLLGVDVTLFDAIKVVSGRKTVLVVIDQLDALASTVDLTSARLNELLDLIVRCSELPNVLVVCSCREFEREYDTRLRTLDATVVGLSLPEWPQVAAQLDKYGLRDANNWTPAFREFLRTPQHLGVFLKHFTETGERQPFESYQAMLGAFWEHAVTNSAERLLLEKLTDKLIDTESLWVPKVQFASDSVVLDSLQARGILAVKSERIGFAHQTLLEYAKARLFTQHERSLCSYVLSESRQDSVLIRPTVWSVLTYLRNADPNTYRGEIEALFANSLRLHLRFLLIDFICRREDLREFEITLIGERLQMEEERVRVLIAIRGQKKWFDSLWRTHFPAIMRLENQEQWSMVPIFTAAWESNFDACLELIKTYWLPFESRDPLTQRAIRDCGRWTTETLGIVKKLIKRAASNRERCFWIEDIVSVVSEAEPKAAPELFAEALKGYLPRESSETESPNRFDSPLERAQGWYHLPAIAAAAPEEFLSAAWSWVVKVAEHYHTFSSGSMIHAYSGNCLSMEDREWARESNILSAVLGSIDAVASDSPAKFVEITKQSWSSENAVVHRLLIRGLIRCSSKVPNVCLEYLLGDRRRMSVGSFSETRNSDSSRLIQAVFPHLAQGGRDQLVASIGRWSKYRDEVEIDDHQRQWDREDRLRLLIAIPSNLRTAEVVELIGSEQRELPEWDVEIVRSRSGMVRTIPPLTSEEMESSSDEATVNAFSLRDDAHNNREWREAEDGWTERGGAYSAGQELAELTKKNPRRGLHLIRALAGASKVEHLGDALRALEESDLSDTEVFELVRELHTYGRESDTLRAGASYLLYRRSKRKVGLPSDIIDILREWLSTPWDHTYRALADTPNEAWKGESSNLWDPSGSFVLDTDRSYFTLLALTSGLLDRAPPASDLWLHTLDEHLDRTISFHTWKQYCRDLRCLRMDSVDREKAENLVLKSFIKFPELLKSTEGVRMIAQLSDIISPDAMKVLLKSLRQLNIGDALQSYGELLTLLAIRDQQHQWSKGVLDEELRKAHSSINGETQPIAVGMAFASARLWSDLSAPKQCAEVLSRVLGFADEKIGRAANTVFWATPSFSADSDTERLLNSVADNIRTLDGHTATYLLEHCCELLPHQRQVILKVCRAITRERYDELRDMRFDTYLVGPMLVEISMTLQRFLDTRSEALGLLEDLLRAGLDDANTVLNEVDLIPANATVRERRTPRRQRQPLRKK